MSTVALSRNVSALAAIHPSNCTMATNKDHNRALCQKENTIQVQYSNTGNRQQMHHLLSITPIDFSACIKVKGTGMQDLS
jgi:hypothetical protein